MRWKGSVLSFSLVFCLCIVSVRPLAAQQNTADVVGTVTDATGAVLPGAAVTITNNGTNVSQTVQTGPTGDYTFTLLQVGVYTVKVESKGFKIFTAPNLTLAAGDRARVNAKMEVGDVTQTVEVSGAVAPALQTDSSNLGSLVTSTAVEDVPLNGRNVTRLVQLAPGVTEGAPGSIASGAHPDDRRQTAAYSVNGQVDSQNNNLIDGMDNNERIIGTIGVRPSIDAIQEVNVSTNLYTAEVGRTSGGVVDIITKSGTNALHGSAYEFFRNKVLNSSPNWFNPATPNPPFRQNQYGASLGGPIKKNKTFFFGDYEGFSSALGYPVINTVPTAFEEANPGNFSDIPNALTTKGASSAAVNISGLPMCPANAPASSAGTCITPEGLDYFKMYPKPNIAPSNAAQAGCDPTNAAFSLCSQQPINNYAFEGTRTQNSKTFDTRIDQHFSDSNTLFARYSFNNVDTYTPGNLPRVTVGGIALDPGTGSPFTQFSAGNGFPGNAYERQQSLALSYIRIINANTVLNLKAGYLRSKIDSYNINQNNPINNKLGWPCNALECVSPPTGPAAAGTQGLMDVAPGGVSGENESWSNLGDTRFVPLLQYDNSFQYLASLSLTRGSHSIKIGAGLIRRRATIIQSSNNFGVSTFAGYYTGNPLADMMEGLTYSITRSNSLTAPGFRTWEPSAYLQDDWRARNWLTLNLGVRYDIFTPYTDIHDAFSNFDPRTGLLISPGLPGPQNTGKTDGVSTNYRDIAPRFGFAATLPHDMVIRGGFGISYFPTNYQSQYYMKNAPFNYSASCQEVIANGQTPCTAFASTDPSGTFALPIAPPANNLPSGTGAGGAWLPLGQPNPVFDITLATNTANYATQSVQAIPFNFPDGYLEQSNLLIQKEWRGNVVTAGWVGEFGHHLGSAMAINSYANYDQQNNKKLPLVLDGFPWWSGGSVTEEGNYGSSAYNALQTSFQRRLKSGLTVNFSYTWAHALALTQTAGCTPNVSGGVAYGCYFDIPGKTAVVTDTNGKVVGATGYDVVYNNAKYGWGNSGQDVADRFTWTASYQIPYGASLKGFEGALLGGWSLNTAGSWQTGIPFTVTMGGGAEVAALDGYRSAIPDQVGSGKIGNPTLKQWFNTSFNTTGAAFITQTPGTIGNERPGQLFGPRLWRVDASVFKNFSISERVTMQFRTEVFNLFNHPEFGQPSSTLGNPGAGSVVALNNNSIPRQIQFALKLSF